MAQPALVLERVVKRFGAVVALDGISLDVREGEFLSLIGPSGCGKTTTLRIMAGLEPPSAGHVYIRGQRVDNLPSHKRNTALVFQNFALFPHMNVRENVEFGLRMRRVPAAERRARALEILATVGLQGLEERDVAQLSGGQKQRVGLARALVTRPDLVLLDEPLGSLDANLRVSMQSELMALQKQLGITFVHVTHNQSEALAMADRIAVISNGRIEQLGPPDEIFATPRTRFVAEFVGKNNLIEGEIAAGQDSEVTVTSPLGPLRVRVEGGRQPGRRAIYVVRADRAVICGGDAPYTNRLTGVLQGVEYTGNIVTYVLRLPNGQPFKLEQHESLTRHRKPTHGETLTVGWNPDDAHLLPEE